MITKIDDYYVKGCGRCDRFDTANCSTQRWSEGLAALRALCHAMGLTEALKWGHPCFMHAGRNVVIFGAFLDDFRLTFFDAAIMRNLDGLLERQGPNTAVADMIRFTSNAQVSALDSVLRRYLADAIRLAEAGKKAPRIETELELPKELVDALEADADLAQGFRALTRGRRNSYVVQLRSVTRPETKVKKVAEFRPKIMAGKGALEK